MKLSQCVEETPVIMISSEESVETMRKAYEMGITDYITRPFDSVIVKKSSKYFGAICKSKAPDQCGR